MLFFGGLTLFIKKVAGRPGYEFSIHLSGSFGNYFEVFLAKRPVTITYFNWTIVFSPRDQRAKPWKGLLLWLIYCITLYNILCNHRIIFPSPNLASNHAPGPGYINKNLLVLDDLFLKNKIC